MNRVPIDLSNVHQLLNAKLAAYEKEEEDIVAYIKRLHENALLSVGLIGAGEKEKEKVNAEERHSLPSPKKLDPYSVEAGRLGPSVVKIDMSNKEISRGILHSTHDPLEV